MTPCNRIATQLVAYADGELSLVEAQVVKDHLATCAECQAELDLLERSLQAARDVWAEAAERLDSARRKRPYSGTMRAALALAAGILILVTAAVGWRATRPRSVRPEVARTSQEASVAEVKESISRAERAARLEASLEILASQPGMEPYYAEAKQYYDRTFGPQADKSVHDPIVN